MRINYNVSAMLSNNALANNDNFLAKSLERLSSGLKINHAKDNPSGLAMAKRMNAQIEGIGVASQNASDGVSIIETADGALTEVTEMLQRMNELSIKAANEVETNDDRETMQKEIAQLKEEITRVSEATDFNGQKLLNGELDLKGYTNMQEIKVGTYSTAVAVKTYTITSLTVSREEVDGRIVTSVAEGYDLGDDFDEETKAEVQDNLLTLKGPDGFEMTLDLTGAKLEEGGSVDLSGLEIEALGIGSMRLQIGANEGQVLAVNIPATNLRNMGIEDIDISTKIGADDAITRIKGALRFVSDVRGRLGAYQNRLESTVNSVEITSVNMTSAYSRIMDVDMAEEMTQYTTYQVLTQAGTSMLAQANERPSQVLQLLQ